ncbi:hypothetical protein L486_05220 [Kwoniella mangroviensis CBS 10435]|uniref:Uncharacterized protein n=1 Tax=Kwoniella mangroviensis CBS 10435 TaxID=1331196 RepID=A0A1B9IQB8_9TREE|nr:hypothetical protein L486_05220 [Kwoniella mangroviensis CBS 10435]
MLAIRPPLGRVICPACRLFSSLSRTSCPSEHPAIQNRSRSIIFDSPIYNPPSSDTSIKPLKYLRREYEHGTDIKGKRKQKETVEADDPYHVMLNSPLRQCIVTRQKFPSAFMVNLRPTYFPPSSKELTGSLKLLPDRIITRGRSKKGKGVWASCHRTVIQHLLNDKGPHIGSLRAFPSITIPNNVKTIIHSQLLQRVQNELEWLSNKLSSLSPRAEISDSSPSSSSSDPIHKEIRHKPILRRLTSVEVSHINNQDGHDRSPAQIGDEGEIIALLDISGLNSSSIATTGLISSSAPDVEDAIDIPLVSIQGKSIPLYNLSTLFPQSSHLHLNTNIKKILSIERKLKRCTKMSSPRIQGEELSIKLNHSDIIALCIYPSGSVDHIQKQRGVVGIPLFVSVWRLRCFLGQGWVG